MHAVPIIRVVKTLVFALLLALASRAFAAEEGLASWYGGKFHGRLTSSGEVFDTNQMTAAHRTLPFGTIVKVINQDNGKSAIVKINDRGPFVEGRIIDLSRAAADELGMVGEGVARVVLEIVDFVTDKALYAVQVGAYGLEKNADKARGVLADAGFVASTEKTALGITRVFVRGISEKELADVEKRLEGLGFSKRLVRREKTEARASIAQEFTQP
jgi:rare lipoprotein A